MINKRKYIVTLFVIIAIIVFFLMKNIINNNEYEKMNLNEIVSRSNVENISNMQEFKQEQDLGTIKIHITGEVVLPGLIELKAGSRIYDAVELAGGLTDMADISKTNLAYILSDGEKVYIPSFEDEDYTAFNQNSNIKVNINTASIKDLEKIPGVGESTAKSIVEYREKTEKYAAIEDIMNVPGIGQSKFEKMKDYICVK